MTPEELDALLAAAWMAGREEAARSVCLECRDEIVFVRPGVHASIDFVEVDCDAAAIRSLPPPTPEQLKEIR